jgi:DNA invertase Pin-like site-specific DNA recombinase
VTDAHTSARLGLYERVSRRNGRDAALLERTTLDEQQRLARAALRGDQQLVADPDRWRDVDVSGTHSDRPGFQRLLDDVESKRIDGVIVGYLSRFGRNMREILANVERITDAGGIVVFAREDLTIKPGKQGPSAVILAVFAAVAQMDVERLREGLELANANAVARGVSIQVPYGYRRADGPGTPLDRDVEFDADTSHSLSPAEVVTMIFAARLRGEGASAIADELNGRGVLTPTALEHARGQRTRPGAQQWKHNTVVGIVETRTYTGVIPRASKWQGKGRDRRPIAWEYLPGKHPELVDDGVWQAAQFHGRAVRNGTTGDSLLQGLVRCASCSRTMRPSRTKQTLTYVCPNKDCARRARITRAAADAYVVEQLLAHHDATETTVDRHAELDGARDALDRAETQLDRWLEADIDDVERFRTGYQQRQARVDDARDRVQKLEQHDREHVTRVLRSFDEYPLADQRAALRGELDAVVVLPAPGRGQAGDVAERVLLVGQGRAPFALSGSGRIVEPRAWPLPRD